MEFILIDTILVENRSHCQVLCYSYDKHQAAAAAAISIQNICHLLTQTLNVHTHPPPTHRPLILKMAFSYSYIEPSCMYVVRFLFWVNDLSVSFVVKVRSFALRSGDKHQIHTQTHILKKRKKSFTHRKFNERKQLTDPLKTIKILVNSP